MRGRASDLAVRKSRLPSANTMTVCVRRYIKLQASRAPANRIHTRKKVTSTLTDVHAQSAHDNLIEAIEL